MTWRLLPQLQSEEVAVGCGSYPEGVSRPVRRRRTIARRAIQPRFVPDQPYARAAINLTVLDLPAANAFVPNAGRLIRLKADKSRPYRTRGFCPGRRPMTAPTERKPVLLAGGRVPSLLSTYH